MFTEQEKFQIYKIYFGVPPDSQHKKNYRIFLAGNPVMLRSGKHIWHQIKHAKVALRTHLRCSFGCSDDRRKLINKIMDTLGHPDNPFEIREVQ